MDRAEIRLKCVDLALNIQSHRTADAVVAEAKKIEAWVCEPVPPSEIRRLEQVWDKAHGDGEKAVFVPVERSGDVVAADPDPVAVPVPKKSNRAY